MHSLGNNSPKVTGNPDPQLSPDANSVQPQEVPFVSLWAEKVELDLP